MGFSLKAALLTLALFLNPSTGWTDDRFDVSYLWHQKHAAVEAYRIRVLGVLGPASASRLKVVKRKNLFGLVYVRAGDIASTKRVAKVHTELLVARNLEPAAPTPARDWKVVTLSGLSSDTQEPVARPSKSSETNRQTPQVALVKQVRVKPRPVKPVPVSYTHLTLPTNREV